MRCHRCHSKIDPGRKMCPVCGTLIKKPRGAFSVTRQAGGSFFGDVSYALGNFFDSVNIKLILAVICGVILAVVVMKTFRCDSCDRSGGFSSCGTPSSCDALAGIGDSCGSCAGSCRDAFSCAVSPGDASGSDISGGDAGARQPEEIRDDRERPSISSVEAAQDGGSCAGRNEDDPEEAPEYESSRNSASNGREYIYHDKLYFCNSSGIYYINDIDETRMLIKSSDINSIYIENDRIYYLKLGELWTASLDSPEAGECIIRIPEQGSGAAVGRIYGFGISGQYICFWRSDGEGNFIVISRSPEDGTERTLYEGRCLQQQVYRGYVYFVSREEEDMNTLYRIPLEGGEKQELIKLPVGYYALCGGNIFAYTWIDGEAELYRIDCASLKISARWDFRSIRGMTADDFTVYYYSNDADGRGSVYSFLPDGTGNKLLFSAQSVIQLNHVAGNYFSLYTGINEEDDNKFSRASYIIIDSDTGDKRIIK